MQDQSTILQDLQLELLAKNISTKKLSDQLKGESFQDKINLFYDQINREAKSKNLFIIGSKKELIDGLFDLMIDPDCGIENNYLLHQQRIEELFFIDESSKELVIIFDELVRKLNEKGIKIEGAEVSLKNILRDAVTEENLDKYRKEVSDMKQLFSNPIDVPSSQPESIGFIAPARTSNLNPQAPEFKPVNSR